MKKLIILGLIIIAALIYFLKGNSSISESIQDSNNNGVRDDVEQEILALYAGEKNHINALFQLSKVMQSSITEAPLSEERAFELDRELVRAINCLYEVGPNYGDDISNLEKWIVNTKERTRRYNKFNALLSGHFTKSTNKAFCDFKAEK